MTKLGRFAMMRWTILPILVCLLTWASGSAKDVEKKIKDDPKAYALYDHMVKTLRDADSLSFQADHRWEAQGKEIGHATYRAWLKKPNHFRVEARSFGSDKLGGILVGDGTHAWTYWPHGKPRYGWEESGKYGKRYDKYKDAFYIKKRTPKGRHSIGHMVQYLNSGMCMTILDLSTFHGYTSSLNKYEDGVRYVDAKDVDGELCDHIEVSIMKGQRSWDFWLSRKDHLPRRMKEVIRVSRDIIKHEVWSNIEINPNIPNEKFVWSPPKGWKEWTQPRIEEGLLKPGVVAPGFELASIDGDEKIRLSDFRGNIVWLNKWRAG
jgi:outer membrane lipoprotein-sorting protein